ncbi:sensor histidine kinase [Labilithrix luteola]|nr:ATP-binding protein [Labilithrix luteola]
MSRSTLALEDMLERREGPSDDLEALTRALSHELRAPLRVIDGFSRILREEHIDKLDADGRRYLDRIAEAAQTMDRLVENLVDITKRAKGDARRSEVDLSCVARRIADRLKAADPTRHVEVVIEEGILVHADASLLPVVFENLLGNAWKFTAKRERARIEVGRTYDPTATNETAYFVSDDGVGFDPAEAGDLFAAFQRLPSSDEFPGTGLGLATVEQIVRRHGGRVWGEGCLGKGATFYFTLGCAPSV